MLVAWKKYFLDTQWMQSLQVYHLTSNVMIESNNVVVNDKEYIRYEEEEKDLTIQADQNYLKLKVKQQSENKFRDKSFEKRRCLEKFKRII